MSENFLLEKKVYNNIEKDEFLMSLIIGDGHITKRSPALQIRHSLGQLEYFSFKENLFNLYGIKLRKKVFEKPSDEKNKLNIRNKGSVCVSTTSTFDIKKLRNYFYPNGIKIIPKDIIISPFMWAIIYQDDGRQNKISHYNNCHGELKKRIDVNPFVNRYTIYTDSFDDESISVLRNSLLYYGVESFINYSNVAKHPHIHISRAKSKENFKNLIDPFIHYSMRYKLDLPTKIGLDL